MRTALLPSAYFPPVNWFREAVKARRVLVEAWETYPKQTYRNRCMIMTANGVLPLSVPVKKVHGRHTKTKDIEILYDEPWQRLHRRSIDTAYRNAPFYLHYIDGIEIFFIKKYRFLLDLDMDIIAAMFRMMETGVDMALTETYIRHPEGITDLRDSISPKKPTATDTPSSYHQVFGERFGFVPGLSILDLLFNEGPLAAGKLLEWGT